jgi:DNA processing protein
MDATERDAWLRLVLTPGVGPRTVRDLLGVFGLPQQVLAAGSAALERAAGPAVARALAGPASAEITAALTATTDWLQADGAHHLLTLADTAYPPALLALTDPPPVLFAHGNLDLLARPALAIVGARSCTAQGAATAEDFAHRLAASGLTIVSGLALGIDAAAHRGALRAHADGAPDSTIAFLGTGIDVVYPRSHAALTAQIARAGVLLSELPLGTPALAHHFPRRNRLIAALGRGVLVVEAALRSGSLITARLGAEMGRDVFAIPGSIHSPLARGCHRLIRDGAKLVESAQDVLEELAWPTVRATGGDAALATEATAAPAPAGPHAALLAALGHDPVDLDTLAARTGQPTGALTAALLELELAQHVERLGGNRYQRLR